jgi:hypothetical protein
MTTPESRAATDVGRFRRSSTVHCLLPGSNAGLRLPQIAERVVRRTAFIPVVEFSARTVALDVLPQERRR